jgi:hypothetical protein
MTRPPLLVPVAFQVCLSGAERCESGFESCLVSISGDAMLPGRNVDRWFVIGPSEDPVAFRQNRGWCK